MLRSSPAPIRCPTPPQETPVDQDQAPAQLQVVPYDALLSPGESQQYSVRLYNSRGQFLQEVSPSEVKFSVAGVGEITPSGKYSAADSYRHEAAIVKCQLGDLTGTSRVRVVPPLPWNFNFEDAGEGAAHLDWRSCALCDSRRGRQPLRCEA